MAQEISSFVQVNICPAEQMFKCYDRVKQLFPKNDQTLEMKLRKQKKYKTNKIRTERFKKSAIPYMQDIMNKEELKKREQMKEK